MQKDWYYIYKKVIKDIYACNYSVSYNNYFIKFEEKWKIVMRDYMGKKIVFFRSNSKVHMCQYDRLVENTNYRNFLSYNQYNISTLIFMLY